MKNFRAILISLAALGLTDATAAHAGEATLVGLLAENGKENARFVVHDAKGRPDEIRLRAGERHSERRLEVQTIQFAAGTAKVEFEGQPALMTLGLPEASGSWTPKPGEIWLRANEMPARFFLEEIGRLTRRTVLGPTSLQDAKITLDTGPVSTSQVFELARKALEKNHISLQAEGEKFLVAQASHLPEFRLPGADAASENQNKRDSTQSGISVLQLRAMPLAQFLEFYQRAVAVRITPSRVPNAEITLFVQNQLSRDELIQAFDAVLLLNGIRLERLEDGTLKAVPASTKP